MRIFLIAMLAVIAWPAFADEARTVDMTTPIKDEKGKSTKDLAEQAGKDDITCAACPVFTVGRAISHALNMLRMDGKDVSGEEVSGDQKWSRNILAERIRDSKSATLTVKEAALIEKLIGKAYPGEVIKQVIPLIDPNKKVPEIQ